MQESKIVEIKQELEKIYGEAFGIERALNEDGLWAYYNQLLEKLEEMRYWVGQLTKETIDVEKNYKVKLANSITALMQSGMKKTPAENQAKEELREEEYRIKQLRNEVEFYKGYIQLAKYSLKKALLEFNKGLTEDESLNS